jgi:nitrate reductase beta subunit
VPDEKDLYAAQLGIFLDPHDPKIIAEARKQGIPEDWLEAARQSPIYKLAVDWKVALPLHPEYRTMPMVWYVPPLSPIMNLFEGKGSSAQADDIFGAIDQMRIPVQYLANLLSAGDTSVIRNALKKMATMRSHMRAVTLNKEPDQQRLRDVGLSDQEIQDMYRLLAIAKYNDRFVIPTAHKETANALLAEQGSCGLNFAGGPGACGVF